VHRRIAILAVVASTLLLMGLSAGQALAAGDDNIPGVPVGAGVIAGVVDRTTDKYDVYAVQLFDAEEVRLTLAKTSQSPGGIGGDSAYHVKLVSPTSKSVQDYTSLVTAYSSVYNDVVRTYTPAKDGIYYIIVDTSFAGINYTVTISGSAEKPPTESYLRLRTSATKVKKGRSVTLSAKLVNVDSALIPGYSVVLMRSYNGRSWTKVTSLTSSTGEYSTKARIAKKTWYKMHFVGDSTWSACASRAVTISLR